MTAFVRESFYERRRQIVKILHSSRGFFRLRFSTSVWPNGLRQRDVSCKETSPAGAPLQYIIRCPPAPSPPLFRAGFR